MFQLSKRGEHDERRVTTDDGQIDFTNEAEARKVAAFRETSDRQGLLEIHIILIRCNAKAAENLMIAAVEKAGPPD